MRQIRILYPGKSKDTFIREGLEKYLKLLKHYAKIELIEVKQGYGSPSEVIEEESARLLKSVNQPFFLLDREGELLSSEEFARCLSEMPKIDFVVGGAFGVNNEIKQMAKRKISLSRLTFTHEMARLILLEQIYRGMTIIHGKEYHY